MHVRARAGPCVWERGLLDCASPAPNHLSWRSRRAQAPIISFQQLLGSSLRFPTMVSHAKKARSHSKNDGVRLVLLSAGVHANSAVVQTLALKSSESLSLAGKQHAFITIPCGRVFRVALIPLCHHLNALTGELMWIKYQRPISCSIQHTLLHV